MSIEHLLGVTHWEARVSRVPAHMELTVLFSDKIVLTQIIPDNTTITRMKNALKEKHKV